jgi:hypothetical protein
MAKFQTREEYKEAMGYHPKSLVGDLAFELYSAPDNEARKKIGIATSWTPAQYPGDVQALAALEKSLLRLQK